MSNREGLHIHLPPEEQVGESAVLLQQVIESALDPSKRFGGLRAGERYVEGVGLVRTVTDEAYFAFKALQGSQIQE